MRDGMHDWALANENMARVLAAKGGTDYQFVFAQNAVHVDHAVRFRLCLRRLNGCAGLSNSSLKRQLKCGQNDRLLQSRFGRNCGAL